MGMIGEERLVLLHASAAEERGIVVRPYGLKACIVDAFGKAVVTVVVYQASRDVIGNLLLVHVPKRKIEEPRRDCKESDLAGVCSASASPECLDCIFTLAPESMVELSQCEIKNRHREGDGSQKGTFR
jgi:hypothetical protein